MLRRRTKYRLCTFVAGAVLLWVAAFGAFSGISSRSPNVEAIHQIGAEQAAENGKKREEPEPFWYRAMSDPVAFFTGWLVILTGGLVFVAHQQTRQLRRTNEHAETIERPWVFVEIVPHLIPMPDGAERGTYGGFYVCNYGQGPAKIRECHETCNVGSVPAAPILNPTRHGSIGPNQKTVVQKMEPLIDVRHAGVNVDLSAGPDESAVSYLPSEHYTGDWFFKIVLKYDGVSVQGRQSAYCWRFDRQLGHWVEYGGGEHNYQT